MNDRQAGLFVAIVLELVVAVSSRVMASSVTLIAPTGEAGDTFGGSVAWAGDVNQDGFDDLVVGALANGAGGIQAGRAYVFLGSSSPDGAADVVFTGTTQSLLGNAVAGAGDVNGDSFDDIIVGAYADDAVATDAGRAYLYWGGTSMDSTADLVLAGQSVSDQFGQSVALAGDFNGDGYSDVLVGLLGSDVRGAAHLFLGSATPDSVPDLIMTGAQPGHWFGFAVASAGDVNGDGYGDVVVGAFRAFNDFGAAYVYFGGDPGDSVADLVLSGETSGDQFGFSVACAGDVDDDGFDDLIVGASGHDTNGNGAGRAYVFLGGPNPDPFPDRVLSGADATDAFGSSVSTAGDIDGDGASDVMVGGRWAGPGGGIGVGTVSIFHGGTFGSTPDDVLSIGAFGDEFGGAIAGGADFDGDGRPDIVVGAARNDVAGNTAGRAYALTPIPLAIVAPNGGEAWASGALEEIRWTGGDLVDLYLSLDAGFSWTAVAMDVGGGIENTLPYIVPATPTVFALVAVAPAGVSPVHATADRSDDTFEIVLPTNAPMRLSSADVVELDPVRKLTSA